ncbi:uncharacterized protein KGF55_004334 [Candida pseudojiufengensis]|uniref:uncharacterized protein n=1 Tax=Candida pseudojiufengensis TaxID=497109 RepID=UPI0022249E19|nr:uncharacterized protein KGF55_004334 [Candida pseudojiufengensis]KAI5960764.1 hypothetical protein KGF55_004334 [Candida pseudojiufengensis]
MSFIPVFGDGYVVIPPGQDYPSRVQTSRKTKNTARRRRNNPNQQQNNGNDNIQQNGNDNRQQNNGKDNRQQNNNKNNKKSNTLSPLNLKVDDIIQASNLLKKSYQTPKITELNDLKIYELLIKTVENYQLNYDHIIKQNPRMTNKKIRNEFYEDLKLIYGKQSILFSLDIEAWELNTNEITEIGISIYDPRFSSITTTAHIHNYHIKIKDHIHRNNGRYVPNHSDNFVGGETLIMSKYNAGILCQALISYFFDHGIINNGMPSYLVGHDLKGDIKWLNQLGVKLPKIYKTIDTSFYTKISKGGKNPHSLKTSLKLLNIPHSFLHNAGNDAYYTLLVALKFMDPFYRISLNLDICLDATPVLSAEEIAEKKAEKNRARAAARQRAKVNQGPKEPETEEEKAAKVREEIEKKNEILKARIERNQKRKEEILNSNVATKQNINSALEALRVMFDETNQQIELMVFTKNNNNSLNDDIYKHYDYSTDEYGHTYDYNYKSDTDSNTEDEAYFKNHSISPPSIKLGFFKK